MSRSLLRSISIPFAAVIVGLLIGAVLIVTQDASPATAYKALLIGGAGDSDAILRTFQKATPLIFGGLAVALVAIFLGQYLLSLDFSSGGLGSVVRGTTRGDDY